MDDSVLRSVGKFSLDLPLRSICTVMAQTNPQFVSFDGLNLAVVDPISSSLLREFPFSDDANLSFIIPIPSRSLVLVSKGQHLLLGFGMTLSAIHSIALDASMPIAAAFFSEQDATLYLSLEGGFLKAFSLRCDLSWGLRWCQQAPTVRTMSRGRCRLFGSAGTTVFQWNCENGNPISTFESSHSSDILALKCSREHVVTAAADGFVKIWALSDRKLLAALEHKKCRTIAIELDDSSIFVASSEQMLRRYNLKTFHLLEEFDLTDVATSLRICQRFLFVIDDSAVSVFEVPAIKVDRRFDQKPKFPGRLPQQSQNQVEVPRLREIATPQRNTKRRSEEMTEPEFYDRYLSLTVQHADQSRPMTISRVRVLPNFRQVAHGRARIPVARSGQPVTQKPLEKARPETSFSKRSLVAKLDCFDSVPKVLHGVSYTNGRVLPCLKSFQPHMGVINSVIRETYIHQLFTAEESQQNDLAMSAEFCFDLLGASTEISQKLLRRSRWVRNKALATLGIDFPIEQLLRATPNLSRSEMQDVNMQMREECPGLVRRKPGVPAGDCWPSVDRRELLDANFRVVHDITKEATVSLSVTGFATMLRFVGTPE